MTVTIKDIAEKAGVSYATVSRALNYKYGVNSTTRQHILEIASTMNYSPNAIARGLVKKQTYTIGLIIPDITNPFFPEVARGVEDMSEKQGYSIFLCNSNWEKSKENRYVKLLIEKRVDGLILAPSSSIVTAEDRQVYSRLPVVMMSGVQSGCGTGSVVVDNIKGGFIAGKYLIEKGRKKLSFIGGAEDSFSVKERYEGFMQAAECFLSVALSPDLVRFGDYRNKSGYRIMKELLEKKNIPDAVFASNDLLAIGILQAIKDAGLKVPEDIAVVGFDNIAAAGFGEVELTTIEHPKYRMGELAAGMLLDKIDLKPEINENERVVLEPELIIRRTA
ncbi:MAG: LacI family DNA-binding transcriptional regulator [Spirochaetia bacterium]|jgi:LacI family transcriptional regulator|nr:LacI family DNA-binding transcriptional regulator [Spirochaetia bacterium]